MPGLTTQLLLLLIFANTACANVFPQNRLARQCPLGVGVGGADEYRCILNC
jgi:hypothetical protein